ncbi:hypothetical protein ACFLZZ_03450 [Nanoarchaeota archaeon]
MKNRPKKKHKSSKKKGKKKAFPVDNKVLMVVGIAVLALLLVFFVMKGTDKGTETTEEKVEEVAEKLGIFEVYTEKDGKHLVDISLSEINNLEITSKAEQDEDTRAFGVAMEFIRAEKTLPYKGLQYAHGEEEYLNAVADALEDEGYYLIAK